MDMFGGGKGKLSSRSGNAFIALVAVVFFLSGILISPLASVFRCSAPRPSLDLSEGTTIAATTGAPPCPPAQDSPLADLAAFATRCRDPIPHSSVRTLLLSKLFDGASPFEDFPPRFAKRWLSKTSISGWGSYGSVFERLVREVKPNIILELGSFLGASATHMVNLTQSILGRPSLVLCVDDFRGWPGFRDTFKLHQPHADVQLLYQFMQNVVTLNMSESILPLPFATVSAMTALCEWGIYADLVEVDASHDFHSAWADINHGYALVRPGGVMFGHDYFNGADNRGVARAVDLFAQMKGLRVEPDGEHWILRSK